MKIESTTATNATAVPTGGLTGSKDEFLRLFMAQLQHQDPLSPKDGSDMVAQLAQFSSVEQAQQTNQHLIDLAAAQDATSSASLANLVGRDCNATAGDFQLDASGAVPALQLTSTKPLTGAVAVITDDRGKELRRIAIPNGASSAQLTWDGRDGNGAQVAPGSYHLTVEPGKTTGAITSQWHGRVDAVELTSDGPRLRMGSVLVVPGTVRTIGMTTSTAT
ncbi:MAG: flagellar hook assembly protein FlgD [Myxococcales bacterium]|nr:flagellar hook assembly protein FlgD [Myxococcales bacterium]